jgi:hypothetical protein
MEKEKVLKLRDKFEDKICEVIEENGMCKCADSYTCVSCIHDVLRILYEN